MVRAKTRAQQEKTKKQNAYIEKYRQDPKYVFEENRNKILRRIKAGSIPHKESLATYKITIETINDIRRRMGLSLLGLHLPYYQEVQRQQEGGMGIPDNSEIFGGFEGGDENEEVEQSAPPPAPTSAPASAPAQENPWDAVARAAPPLFTVEDISLYLQKNPGKASAKSNKDASNKTRDTQWGRPNPRGFQNTGNLGTLHVRLTHITRCTRTRLHVHVHVQCTYFLNPQSFCNQIQYTHTYFRKYFRRLSGVLSYLASLASCVVAQRPPPLARVFLVCEVVVVIPY